MQGTGTEASTLTAGASPNSPVNLIDDDSHYSYMVKVVDPTKKGQYKVHRLRLTRSFTTCSEIRSALKETLSEHVPDSDNFDIGDIEPGRQGIRGKTRWIFDADDIEDMYREYQSAGKFELIIWCDGRRQDCEASKKRPTAGCNEPVARKKARTSCNDRNLKTLDEVEAVFQQLDEKHNGKFTIEQLRMWAHMINMGKHTSLETPPDKPFFRGNKKLSKIAADVATTDISPAKRSNLRSQYMTQMKDWHALFESAAITKEEYEEQKTKILEDLKKL